jgi:uncharacterized repeat protein (TIGR03803 family)
LDGSGQNVGLVELEGYYAADITTYENQSVPSLPQVPLDNIYSDGMTGTPDSTDTDGIAECSLDIEMAISMAPGLTEVYVFEGNVTDHILENMVANPEISQFSCSWTLSYDATADDYLQQMESQGQSFFQASGDGDAWVSPIAWPCDDPDVTSVGGTALNMNGSSVSYASETVWNSGNLGASHAWPLNGDGYWGSGGGVSSVYSIPGWQQSVNTTAAGGSSSMRNIPDVALTADDVWVIYDSGLSGSFMGTSCAAPLWAGFMALVNQQRVTNGATPIGFLNPAIYAIGQSTNYAACFHDITNGNNTWSGSPNKFNAGSGYDLCTGWGTVGGSNLINALQQTVIVLHSFTGGSDGANPFSGLTLSGSTLYGTTKNGGSFDGGAVFSVNTNGSGFAPLHSFSASDDNGYSPQAGMILVDNTLYGTTDSGGTNYDGTIFAVNTDGSGFTTLYTFSNSTTNDLGIKTNSDGSSPDGTLVLSGNTLYGTAFYGGTNGYGTIFAVSTDGSVFTPLYNFTGGSDGAYPNSGLTSSGQTLYGTAEYGGSSVGRSGYGVVFAVNNDGSNYRTLHTFTGGNDGSDPLDLLLSGNTLYGNAIGFSGNGTVFAVNTDGSSFRTLHNFTATNFTFPPDGFGPAPGYNNSDGVFPTGLTLSGNAIYGAALEGGASGNGTVFTVNTDGSNFTILHNFTTTPGPNLTNTEGSHPVLSSGLILSGNNLYGTAYYGGDSGSGTVFALSLAPLVATASLHNGTNNMAYSQTLTAAGGQLPYSWSLISGGLPPGLILATNGGITGIPTAVGTFNFTSKVTDAANHTATRVVFLVVVPAQPDIASWILSGANLVLNGINGQSGGTYYILMGTNLAQPLSQWTPIATNVLSTSGNFTITATNTVTRNVPQRFYILQTH